MALDEFLTGALKQGSIELTEVMERQRAKKERERRLRIMQQAATALQRYQKTGEAVDPKLAAEAASVGFQMPSEALRGFDPTVLEGGAPSVQTGRPQVPQVTPAGRLDAGAVPGGAGAISGGATGAPLDAEALFQAGAISGPEAIRQKQTEQRNQVLAQRQAEAHANALGTIGRLSAIQSKHQTPNQVVEYYDALVLTGQDTEANKILTERRAVPKGGRGSGTRKDQILDGSEWAAIEAAVDRGSNDMTDFNAHERTLINLVFTDSDERADFLGSGKGGKDVWKLGVSGIRGQKDILWRHEMLFQMDLEAWMNDSPNFQTTAAKQNYLRRNFDKRTGEIKPEAILRHGEKAIAALEKRLKASDAPSNVRQFVQDLVAAHAQLNKNLPPEQHRKISPAEIQKQLDADGITYNINKILDLYEEQLLILQSGVQ